MSRVYVNGPASSTALTSIVFGFFAMGFMTKFEARQAFQSTRLTYRLFLHFLLSPLTKREKSNFGCNSVMQCVIKQFVVRAREKHENTKHEASRLVLLSSSVSRWLSKFVLLHEKRPWGVRCLPIVFVSFSVLFAPFFVPLKISDPNSSIMCTDEFFCIFSNNSRAETFQNIFLVQLRPLHAPMHVRSNYEFCQKFIGRWIGKLCSAACAGDAFSM